MPYLARNLMTVSTILLAIAAGIAAAAGVLPDRHAAAFAAVAMAATSLGRGIAVAAENLAAARMDQDVGHDHEADEAAIDEGLLEPNEHLVRYVEEIEAKRSA